MRYLWYSMYTFATALAVYALFFRPATPAEPPVAQDSTPVVQPTPDQPIVPLKQVAADVQIAILLDTSSSMDGLVEQARSQLWEMVAEMQMDENDKERTVAVALYQYGNSRLSKEDGFIEQLAPLTTDLDMVTVKLHSLGTTGGKEYAPLAIKKAVEQLDWNQDDSVERIIVIAGNEGFQQGPLSSKDAFSSAERLGIRVLPIYCGNQGASKTAVESWKFAAELAGTDFESIDPDQQVAKLETPYDAEIMRKYQELKETRLYAPGSAGSRYSSEAANYVRGGVAIDRAVVQSRQTAGKDIVSSYGGEGFSLEAVPAAQMPVELQNKTRDEQAQLLRERQKKQDALKKEIAELNDKRQELITQKAAAAPSSAPLNLGQSFRRNAHK